MRGLVRILFTLFVLGMISVPVQAALTSSSPQPKAMKPQSRGPSQLVSSGDNLNGRRKRKWVTIPEAIQATVPGRKPTPTGKTLTPYQPPKPKVRKNQFHTNAATTSKVVYLTFDDGPGGQYTLDVLADLEAYGDVGTFFETGNVSDEGALALGEYGTSTQTKMSCGVTKGDVCDYAASGIQANGTQASSTPESGTGSVTFGASGTYNGTTYSNSQIPALLHANGMQLGIHSWDHPDFQDIETVYKYKGKTKATDITLTDEEIGNDISASETATGGYFSGLFRYPHFDASQAGNAYLASRGMKTVSADIEPNDWEYPYTAGCACGPDNTTQGTNPNSIDYYIEHHITNGAIIGLHDGTDVLNSRPAMSATGITTTTLATDGPNDYLPQLLAWLKANGYTTAIVPSVAGAH